MKAPLAYKDGGHCGCKKENRENDGSSKNDFFKTAFGPIHVTLSSECGGKAGPALL